MISRLASLYGDAKANRIEREWAGLRKRGLDAAVDGEKSRQCRRMYSLSQYVKTAKAGVRLGGARNPQARRLGTHKVDCPHCSLNRRDRRPQKKRKKNQKLNIDF